jgi:hypothetical protein
MLHSVSRLHSVCPMHNGTALFYIHQHDHINTVYWSMLLPSMLSPLITARSLTVDYIITVRLREANVDLDLKPHRAYTVPVSLCPTLHSGPRRDKSTDQQQRPEQWFWSWGKSQISALCNTKQVALCQTIAHDSIVNRIVATLTECSE